MTRVCTVVGARPQFIKASPVSAEFQRQGIVEDIVHTGQHYDEEMSRVFFDEMAIPEPVVNLGVGSGSHGRQTGEIMTRLEAFVAGAKPYNFVLVYGDTNSTLAAALVASKLHIPLAHVEAGLRSFNRRMPEEINRLVADRLSSLLLCPSESAVRNLDREGVSEGVVNTGDVMYDALLSFRPRAVSNYPVGDLAGLEKGDYYLATVHRAENTDDAARLRAVLEILQSLDRPVVWPLHPRTAQRFRTFDLSPGPNIRIIDPCGYQQMLSLLDGAHAVLTDSGGVQKEALWSGVPCVTLRGETEWVETLEGGWNVVAGLDADRVLQALSSRPKEPRPTPYGDGRAAVSVARAIADRAPVI